MFIHERDTRRNQKKSRGFTSRTSCARWGGVTYCSIQIRINNKNRNFTNFSCDPEKMYVPSAVIARDHTNFLSSDNTVDSHLVLCISETRSLLSNDPETMRVPFLDITTVLTSSSRPHKRWAPIVP